MFRCLLSVSLVIALPLLMGQACVPAPTTGNNDATTGGGDNTSSPLVGRWVAQTEAGCTFGGTRSQVLEFRDDGTALFDNVYNCGGTNLVHWSVSGSELTVDTGTAFGAQVYGFAITGNTLSITRGNGLVAETLLKE